MGASSRVRGQEETNFNREKNPTEPRVMQTAIISVLLPDPQKIGNVIKQTYGYGKRWEEKYRLM
jgi:hypothetical protein